MSKKLPVVVNEEDFIELIKATKWDSHKLAFLLGYGSGLRISEVVKLKPEQINIKEKKIMVLSGKGNKDRIVPLPKGFKEKHLSLLPLKFKNVKSGIRSLEIAFKKSAEKSGLLAKKPTAHFHSLRHGFGSNSAGRGIPVHHIRTLMGHSNISTTNVYLELNPTEALGKYEELF